MVRPPGGGESPKLPLLGSTPSRTAIEKGAQYDKHCSGGVCSSSDPHLQNKAHRRWGIFHLI
jgi:hypothetical protein